MLTLGTGVGGGVVIRGQTFRGATGLGAELGHVTLNADGPECPGACPGRGCVEAYCSGTALERDATAVARERPESRLGQVAGDPDGRVTGRDVVGVALEGGEDPAAQMNTPGRCPRVATPSCQHVSAPDHV